MIAALQARVEALLLQAYELGAQSAEASRLNDARQAEQACRRQGLADQLVAHLDPVPLLNQEREVIRDALAARGWGQAAAWVGARIGRDGS